MPYQVFRMASTFWALVVRPVLWSLLMLPILVAFAAMPSLILAFLEVQLASVFFARDDLAGWPVYAMFFTTTAAVFVGGLAVWAALEEWSPKRVKDFVREELWIEAQLPRLKEVFLGALANREGLDYRDLENDIVGSEATLSLMYWEQREAGTGPPWGMLRSILREQIGSFKRELDHLEKNERGYGLPTAGDREVERLLVYGLSLKGRRLPWQ